MSSAMGPEETMAFSVSSQRARFRCLSRACGTRSSRARAVASAISDNGFTASSIGTDVTSEESTVRMGAAALERYGAIDAIYCNAGIVGVGNAMDLAKSEWDRVIGVMLTGVWLSMKAVLATMVANGSGSIVNQASIGGLIALLSVYGGEGAATDVYGPYSTVSYIALAVGVGWLFSRSMWPAASPGSSIASGRSKNDSRAGAKQKPPPPEAPD